MEHLLSTNEIVMDVFMRYLDDGSIALSNYEPSHCDFLSYGRVGYICCSTENVCSLGKVEVCSKLRNEIVEYSLYLQGRCYGFAFYDAPDCPRCQHPCLSPHDLQLNDDLLNEDLIGSDLIGETELQSELLNTLPEKYHHELQQWISKWN